MGLVHETPHGVKMRFPTDSKPYFRLDYTLGGLRRQPSVGKDQAAAWAEACRVDLLMAAQAGDVAELAASELLNAWREHHKDMWSKRYVEMVKYHSERSILPVLETVAIGDLSRSDLKAVLAATPTPSGKRQVYTILSSMVRWGISEDWLDRSHEQLMPAKDKTLKKPKVEFVPQDAAPETADVLALVREVGKTRTYPSKHTPDFTPPEYWQYMLLVGAFCGLRLGEMLELRGVDVQGRVLSVSRQVQEIEGAQVVSIPKANKGRQVFIPEQVAEFPLRDWLNKRAAVVGSDGLLFPATRGGVWWRGRWNRSVFQPARKRVWSGKTWTYHSLRHHFCRWLLSQGVEAKDVSMMAGHSTVRVTLDLYVSATASVFDRLQEKIG